MQTILIVVHLFLAIGVVTLVLLQHGKGADAGAAFGSGASATVFGARGSASFLSRATAILAALFFLTSMAMAYFASQAGKQEGLMDNLAPPTEAPVAPLSGSDMPVAPGAGNATATDLPPVPVAEPPIPARDVPVVPPPQASGDAGVPAGGTEAPAARPDARPKVPASE